MSFCGLHFSMATMTTRLTLLVAALSLAVSACGSPTASNVSDSTDPPIAKESTPQEDPEEGSTTSPDQATQTSQSPGSYITLADYEANRTQFDDTSVVLFFNAAWCSTCKKARENIEADLAGIPTDLTIVNVDFDDADDLRRKYGVTLQHTFVQIDPAGNELAKWSGSSTASQIAENTV